MPAASSCDITLTSFQPELSKNLRQLLYIDRGWGGLLRTPQSFSEALQATLKRHRHQTTPINGGLGKLQNLRGLQGFEVTVDQIVDQNRTLTMNCVLVNH